MEPLWRPTTRTPISQSYVWILPSNNFQQHPFLWHPISTWRHLFYHHQQSGWTFTLCNLWSWVWLMDYYYHQHSQQSKTLSHMLLSSMWSKYQFCRTQSCVQSTMVHSKKKRYSTPQPTQTIHLGSWFTTDTTPTWTALHYSHRRFQLFHWWQSSWPGHATPQTLSGWFHSTSPWQLQLLHICKRS